MHLYRVPKKKKIQILAGKHIHIQLMFIISQTEKLDEINHQNYWISIHDGLNITEKD